MKKRSKICILLLIVFTLTNVLNVITTVSAQSIMILGEIKARGMVFIESSNGQWAPSGTTYPLLQNTAIKTEDGSASIYFSEGSRVDLSKETMALFKGFPADYSINLTKGIIAFNINSSSSLSVSTASTNIYINNKKSVLQKVAYEKPGRVLGAVFTSDKGTEIKSISGKISVSTSVSGTKLITAGESIFIGSDGRYKVYNTQAVKENIIEDEAVMEHIIEDEAAIIEDEAVILDQVATDEESYLIKQGDLLEIKTEGLDGTVRVNSEGEIILPHDVTLHVEGMTTAEAKQAIAEKLGKSVQETFVAVLEKAEMAGLPVAVVAATGKKIPVSMIVGGAVVVGGAVIAISAMGGDSGVASPSGFLIK